LDVPRRLLRREWAYIQVGNSPIDRWKNKI
jgi:hypothetical protein